MSYPIPETSDTFAVVTGDPIGGFQFFGPFDAEDEAVEWADRKFDDTDWWVAVVFKPE